MSLYVSQGGVYHNNDTHLAVSSAQPKIEGSVPIVGACARFWACIKSIFSFSCIDGDERISYLQVNLPGRVTERMLCTTESLNNYIKVFNSSSYRIKDHYSLIGREITIEAAPPRRSPARSAVTSQ